MDKALLNQIAKLSLGDFQSYLQSAETEAEKTEIIRYRCATDLELFSEIFFAHYCTREFNDFHREMFSAIGFDERNVRRVRAAPRGSAKSTLATLIKPIHDVCYGLEKFILILSSTTPLANKKLKDIRSEVLSNSNLRFVYGVRFPGKKAGESEFTVTGHYGSCHFQAVGRGAQVRGIRINEARPTKIILDDVEHSEEVYNEKSREKTLEWYTEDVTKAGDSGTNIEFVGTVLHRDALLSRLLKNPAYDGKVFKAILSWSDREDLWNTWREIYRNIDDPNRISKSEEFFNTHRDDMLKGTAVLWPEKEDYLAHMKDLEEIGHRAFMKEKQNDPQGTDETVFEKFHWYKETPDGFQLESTGAIVKLSELECIGAIDPATGQGGAKSAGDFTCLLTGYKDLKGRVFVHSDITKRLPPTRYIQAIFECHERYNYQRFSIETNLYRNLLLPNIMDEKKRREEASKKPIRIPFYDCEQTENKRERIYRLEPKVNHGMILFNRALSPEFKNQVSDFPNATHDDCPDALEQLWMLANNRYKAAAIGLNLMSGR